jgi:hypothetical protein
MALSAQVVLTPTESKRLLSKAVLALSEVKKALDGGIVVIHPSSTTIFMLGELGYTLPEGGIWVCGHISPKGLCISRGMLDAVTSTPDYGPEHYPFDLVLQKGKLLPIGASTLGPTLNKMTAEDVYVKSVNAIDPDGKLGVLLAGRSSGGSIGLVLNRQKQIKFKMIIPVGLEKRISVSLAEAQKAAIKTTKAQGIPCGLWQLRGMLITEVEAFRQLFDVNAIPISAGGIEGAEGAVVWVLEGDDAKVQKAYDVCQEIHGTKPPYLLDTYECDKCPNGLCDFAGSKNTAMKA